MVAAGTGSNGAGPGSPGGKSADGMPTEVRFAGQRIRIIDRDGEPWFVAADVCEAIGIANVSVAVSRVALADKTTTLVCTVSGDQDMLIVSDNGILTLVGRSRKSQAESFYRWLNSEILPLIRQIEPDARLDRDGAHVSPERQTASDGVTWVCTSPGPVVGSMRVGDVVATLDEFLAFMTVGRTPVPSQAPRYNHPSENNVLRYLEERGRGDECLRHPFTGRWVFRMAALQDWYRAQGSVKPTPPP